MKTGLIGLLVAGACFCLSGCAGSGAGPGFEELSIPDTTSSVSRGDLRIGAMDLIQVEIFDVESLNGTYQVDFGGKVKLPLVGEIDAIGKTPSELSGEIERLYGEAYLQDPDVSVSIVESVGRRITLDGAVNSPGLYPITGSISLLQAVAMGGGPAQTANPRRVVIFRQIDGERHAAAFNLNSIRNGKAEDPEIFGNDIIVVDGSNINAAYQTTIRSIPLFAFFMAF